MRIMELMHNRWGQPREDRDFIKRHHGMNRERKNNRSPQGWHVTEGRNMATDSSKESAKRPQATGRALLSMQKDESKEQFMERAKAALVKSGILKKQED